MVNGVETDFFLHKQGLQQGDPLSPMLFNIAVDVLQQIIQVLNSCLQTQISAKLDKAVIAHQYADDTAIIAASDESTVVSLKIILRLFTSVSGLSINYEKSKWIPINVRPSRLPMISAILGCTRAKFPI